ncbi:DUF1428 domain-containing protein [Croceibacterium ferulae]|uniref:DUF1428 domain-containing protein n=1 Tax=Croceibacterium ferulae TaxID=1854641 RepID=UPI0019D47B2D|nr:DUF1428 domain-containing protein [Croceibacterium ferulae]
MYVSGFLLAVPEDKKEAYCEMAAAAGPFFQKHGAIEIMEAWEEDVRDGQHTDFRMAVKAEAGEKIVFSWIIRPSKEAADLAETAMMTDPDMQMPEEMPFDGKRMIFGGFAPIYMLGR